LCGPSDGNLNGNAVLPAEEFDMELRDPEEEVELRTPEVDDGGSPGGIIKMSLSW
jgi:hypothetical protein